LSNIGAVIEKLYKEYFFLLGAGYKAEEIISIIAGNGRVIYDENYHDNLLEVRRFIKKYANITTIHPTIAQLYFLHLKYNLSLIDTLSISFAQSPEINYFPILSEWVSLEDVFKFYSKYSTNKFGNHIKLSKKQK